MDIVALGAGGELSRMSKRELQAYAAACLARFCASTGIRSPHVNEFIGYLLRVLISENLPQWEGEGGRLEIAGRGDPFPDDLVVPERVAQALHLLVHYVAEVGLVDMYSADTLEPVRFLTIAVQVLESEGVPVPSPEEVLGSRRGAQGDNQWGPPLADIYGQASAWCRRELRSDIP